MASWLSTRYVRIETFNIDSEWYGKLEWMIQAIQMAVCRHNLFKIIRRKSKVKEKT